MKKSNLYLSALFAGLMAVGAAQAQTAPAAGSTDGPPKAGEASNQTQGVPNAKTTNSPAIEMSAPPPEVKMTREQVRAELMARRGIYLAALHGRARVQ